MWGIRTFCRFCPEECGVLGGDSFYSMQDGSDHSRNHFWVHFGTLERTQVFTGICGIPFSAECTIGMVWELTALKHCGIKALWQ